MNPTRPLPMEVRRDWLPALDVDVLAVAWDDYHRLQAQRAAWDALPDGQTKAVVLDTQGPKVAGRQRKDVEDVDYDVPPLDLGPLDALRAEHHQLIGAWEAATRLLRDAESAAAEVHERHRQEVRAAARAGKTSLLLDPGAEEVARVRVEVLGEDAQAARVALGAFVERAVGELRLHRAAIGWVRNVMLIRPPRGGDLERQLRGQARLVLPLDATLRDAHNRLPDVARWATGATVDLAAVADAWAREAVAA